MNAKRFSASSRRIPGFDGYIVSDRGVIYGPRGHALRPSRSDSGYLRVTARGRRLFVARAVLLAFVGPPPSHRHEAAHADGNKDNNALWNLSWKTRRQNEADKRRHGTAPRGFTGHRDASHVRKVRNLLARGLSYAHVAKRVGLHRHSVSRIARGLRHAS
jgi:hypothetical protein